MKAHQPALLVVFIALTVVFIALARRSPPPASPSATRSTAEGTASTATAASQLELARAVERAPAAATPVDDDPTTSAARDVVPVPAVAIPDHEQIGVALPVGVIEGIVLRGMQPVNAGTAWLVRTGAVPSAARNCAACEPALDDPHTQVGADGVFRFDVVAPGDYCVGVDVDPGLRRVVARRMTAHESTVRLVVRLGESGIAGRVYERDGASSARIPVRLSSRGADMSGVPMYSFTSTAGDGSYRFDGLNAGSFVVEADRRGRASESIEIELATSEHRTVDFGSPRGDFTWSGRIEAPDGAALRVPWSVIVAQPGGALRSFRSNDDGSFSVALPPGRFALSVDSVGGWREFGALDMPAADIERDLELPPAWVAVKVRFAGAAPDAEHALATLAVYLSQRDTRTQVATGVRGTDGVFHFVGVPAGEYDLWAVTSLRPGKPPALTPLSIHADERAVRADLVIAPE